LGDEEFSKFISNIILQEKTRKGKVFAYSGSSIAISRSGEYILKVHGLGMYNVLMQVESEKDLILWNDWFNTSTSTTSNGSSFNSSTIDGNNNLLEGETFLADTHKPKNVGDTHDQEHFFSSKTKEVILSAEEDETKPKRLSRQTRLDSGITTHHLLGDDHPSLGPCHRRGSDMTEETLDSCFHQPALSLSDYGIHEINHARQKQQQRLRTNEQTMAYSRSMVLGSITDDEHRLTNNDHTMDNEEPKSSFFSSFAGYLAAEDSAAPNKLSKESSSNSSSSSSSNSSSSSTDHTS
jgi:hypothetical protein